jgi:excisionase family DNA binding protein
MDERLTVDEAARELGLSARATRELIRKGELVAYRPTPRKTYVLRKSLNEFCTNHQTARRRKEAIQKTSS